MTTTDWILAVCAVLALVVTLVRWFVTTRKERRSADSDALDKRLVDVFAKFPSNVLNTETIAAELSCTADEAEPSLLRAQDAGTIERSPNGWKTEIRQDTLWVAVSKLVTANDWRIAVW